MNKEQHSGRTTNGFACNSQRTIGWSRDDLLTLTGDGNRFSVMG